MEHSTAISSHRQSTYVCACNQMHAMRCMHRTEKSAPYPQSNIQDPRERGLERACWTFTIEPNSCSTMIGQRVDVLPITFPKAQTFSSGCFSRTPTQTSRPYHTHHIPASRKTRELPNAPPSPAAAREPPDKIMRASSVSIASVLALLASGGVDGFTSSVKAPGSRWVRGAAQRRQQQDVGSRRHRSNTVVVSMSPTVPPQLPDVNQNLSGGDFDK